jgi:uncharacterized protein
MRQSEAPARGLVRSSGEAVSELACARPPSILLELIDALWQSRGGGRMSSKQANKTNPQAVFGFAILFFVAVGVFVYVAKQRQMESAVESPKLTRYVVFDSNLIGRTDEVAMEEALAKVDTSGAAQIVVVARMRLARPIAEEALQFGRQYRIGHAGRNDGVILLLSAQDKQARIEVGYDLEEILTDARSRLIIANQIEPALMRGEVGTAARLGVDALIALLPARPQQTEDAAEPGVGWLLGVGLFMLVILLIALGILQAILLAIPPVARAVERSNRWRWIGRVRILGSSSRDRDRDSSSGSGGSSIGGGGSFGGGGANN